MRGIRLTTLWWRGLFAALLLLGMFVSQASAASEAAMPGWLAQGICHASDEPQSPSAPKHGIHTHCALCQIGQVADLSPVPPSLPLPREGGLASAYLAAQPWPGPAPLLAYASRAPPPG
jgi:hypothetical protein